MDRNELKVHVLQLFSSTGSMDGSSVLKKLSEKKAVVIDIHAVRMALMRYYKQGLLKRERSGGTFTYTISERGMRRLSWLEQHPTNPHK